METISEEVRHEIRTIVRQEMEREKLKWPKEGPENPKDVPGLLQKPLYSMQEVRQLFGNVSRSTVYAWVKDGRLQPRKLKGKVYFLWEEIEQALKEQVRLTKREDKPNLNGLTFI